MLNITPKELIDFNVPEPTANECRVLLRQIAIDALGAGLSSEEIIEIVENATA